MTVRVKRAHSRRSVKRQIQVLLQRYHRSSLTFGMAEVLRLMPDVCEADVQKLLAACLRRGWYDLAVLASLHYDEALRFMSPRVDPRPCLTDRFCFDVVKSSRTPLPRLKALLSHWSTYVIEQALDWSVGAQGDDDLEVFQMLVNGCSASDVDRITRVAMRVRSAGMAPQYRVLLSSPNPTVRQAARTCFRCRRELLYMVCQERHHRITDASRDTAYNTATNTAINTVFRTPDYLGCLVAACEAGLFFASPPSCPKGRPIRSLCDSFLGLAVEFNQPDLVRYLLSTSDVGYDELFQVCHHPTLTERCQAQPARPGQSPRPFPTREDGEAAREIRDLLLDKLSQTRSLESLCLDAISAGLGWGHVREEKMGKLGIPWIFKEALKFKNYKALLKTR